MLVSESAAGTPAPLPPNLPPSRPPLWAVSEAGSERPHHKADSRGLSLLHVARLCLHAAVSFVLASAPATVPKVRPLPLKQGRRAQCQGCPRPGICEGAGASLSGASPEPLPPASLGRSPPAHSTPLRRRGDATPLIEGPRDGPSCGQGPGSGSQLCEAAPSPAEKWIQSQGNK